MESLIVLLFSYLFELLAPVFNVLFEILLRILLEIIFTPVAYFFERLFSKFQAPLSLKIFANAAIGGLLGRLSLEFYPQLAIAETWLRAANILATPLISAALIVFLKFFTDKERNSFKLAGTFARAYALIFFILASRAYFGLSMPVDAPRGHAPSASVLSPVPALTQPAPPPAQSPQSPRHRDPADNAAPAPAQGTNAGNALMHPEPSP